MFNFLLQLYISSIQTLKTVYAEIITYIKRSRVYTPRLYTVKERKHSICSDLTVYNKIIFQLCFNEQKDTDLSGNKPLSFQQFLSARILQSSSCHLFS